MHRIGLWNNTDHRTWFPRQQFHWIKKDDMKTWFWINKTASTFVRYKTIKKTYMYENRCPCAQKHKDKIKILNSHDRKIPFLMQAYAANKSVVILCLFPLKNLTVLLSPSVLHLLPFTCDVNWLWCNYVYMPLLLPGGGEAVRFSWQTDMTRHWKHSKFYGATCHFRHHCLQAKENNTKQTGDTEHAR